MPLYAIRCPICGKEDEMFRKLAECNNTPLCCDNPMERMISAPQVMADIQPYRSMATGEMITSRKRHREHLKERGLLEVGDQDKAQRKIDAQRKKDQQKKNFEALKQEVAARIHALPTK